MVKVGSTLSATPASVTGDPTPVRSWQWLRDNVTISGATAANYYVQAADEGARLSVRQIETNFVGVASATSAQTATVGAYDPGTLFESGEVGAWYDPSDLTTVYQDAAGTTPAGVGDPVGRIDDKSGNGNHATQTTSAARPVLQQSGDLYYLDFDGVDDQLIAPDFASAQAQPNTLAFVLQPDVAYSSYRWAISTNSAVASDFCGLGFWSGFYRVSAGTTVNFGVVDTSAHVHLAHYNSISSSVRTDGSVANSGNYGTNAWKRISMGALAVANSYYDGRIYSFVGVNRTLTAGEIDDLETYLAAKSGVTL